MLTKHLYWGSPPEWRNRDLPFTLPLDSSTDFVDQNPHRITMNSLQPMMTAIDIHFQNHLDSELFDWTAVDFITARNGLRKLLRWITCAAAERYKLKPFRIDLQLVGSRTVIFKRWEWEESIGQHPMGYGVNFKQAMTVPGRNCRKSTSHERVVSYVIPHREVSVGLTKFLEFQWPQTRRPISSRRLFAYPQWRW